MLKSLSINTKKGTIAFIKRFKEQIILLRLGNMLKH